MGYANDLPWAEAAAEPDEYAAANIGQAKQLFSFDLFQDLDGNGLADWWEMHHFGKKGVDPAGDADFDGVNNADELAAGTDPDDLTPFATTPVSEPFDPNDPEGPNQPPPGGNWTILLYAKVLDDGTCEFTWSDKLNQPRPLTIEMEQPDGSWTAVGDTHTSQSSFHYTPEDAWNIDDFGQHPAHNFRTAGSNETQRKIILHARTASAFSYLYGLHSFSGTKPLHYHHATERFSSPDGSETVIDSEWNFDESRQMDIVPFHPYSPFTLIETISASNWEDMPYFYPTWYDEWFERRSRVLPENEYSTGSDIYKPDRWFESTLSNPLSDSEVKRLLDIVARGLAPLPSGTADATGGVTEDNRLVETGCDRYFGAVGEGSTLTGRWEGASLIDGIVLTADYWFTSNDCLPTDHTWVEHYFPDGEGKARIIALRTFRAGERRMSPVYALHQGATMPMTGGIQVYSLPLKTMVDANRDGKMDLEDSDIDLTSFEKPYRFWLNNDCDRDDGDQPAKNRPDSKNAFIYYKRDLEDFTRLWVTCKGITELIKTRGVTAELHLEAIQGGSPSIKIFRHIDPAHTYDTGYVKNEASANAQLATLECQVQVGPAIVAGSSLNLTTACPDLIKGLSEETPNLHFLFEGVTSGKAKLNLVLKKGEEVIGKFPDLFVDLRDIKTMYQHKVLGGENPWIGFPFEPAPDETDDAIIFVHGWRMSPEDTASFSETMFKRLWWRGFKGRFAAVRWDTHYNKADLGWVPYAGQEIKAYLAKYNDSEHNAWLTGQALAAFVNNELPTGYTRNVVAHSMGNVVAGAALQQGMIVTNYALLNAAIPAACYDERPELKPAPATKSAKGLTIHLWDQDTTPDDDPDPPTRGLAYRGRLKNVTGDLISFYLPQDHATSYAWEINNVISKPPANPGNRPEYSISNSSFGYIRSAPSGQKLVKYYSLSPNQFLNDRDEANSYACRTWAKAVGAEGRTRGKLSRDGINLGTPAFGSEKGLDTEHSGEFDRDIQKLVHFYNVLLDEFNIPRN